MQSSAPSSEWDDDAVTSLAILQGWEVVRDGACWHLYRPFDAYAVDTFYGDSTAQVLQFLAKT